MILLEPAVARNLDGTLPGLRCALQHAIELEHATLPTYLYALYSLVPGKNDRIAAVMLSVILEEMLHMALACNILNAVGGHPVIDTAAFVPTYPGPLPGGVESQLQVPLSPFSLVLIENVFMVIEEPEDPLHFPVLVRESGQVTIGQFYESIKQTIVDLSKTQTIFTGDASFQLTTGFPSSELIAVNDVASASAAIETIVQQGEGTSVSPLDPQHEPAHYYRYAEILYGRALVKNPNPPPDFAYAGEPIPFDPGGVYPVVTNPAVVGYPPGSAAAYQNDTFNYTYTSLLKTLHTVFNGRPGELPAAIGLMEALKELAFAMMSATPAGPGAVPGLNAGPSFQYRATNP